MTEKVKEILKKHKMWLNDVVGGECADLSSAKLSSADLSGADLSGADLSGADLRGANLICADLNGADLSSAKLSSADLSGADLNGADLSGADLRGANLICADLSGADLTGANLSGTDLTSANLIRADLTSAKLIGANLSGATGLMQQWEFLKNNFDSTAEGIVAYKTFGDVHVAPAKWKIEKGAIITENVDFNRTIGCGCGINVAPIEWVKRYYKGKIWKVLIRWEWLAGICVPYNSGGQIRCECVELIEIID